MAAKPITLEGEDWWRKEREPAKRDDHPVVLVPIATEDFKDLRKVLKIKEVADFLGCSAYTVYEWCKLYTKSGGRKGLRWQPINGRKRVYKADLITFLQMQRTMAGG
jgi:hypothetical protein